jgi:ligand-binding SRPBCC domain-containing protein
MPTIRLLTPIAAPPHRCFNLARDTTIHVQSLAHTGERIVAAPLHNPMELGDTVTWEACHFGIRQCLTARITHRDPPRCFVDKQVRGAFASFTHTHEFEPAAGGTTVIDTFAYTSPLGPLGRIADALFLRRYMQRLLQDRALHLKRITEAGGVTARIG